MKVYAVYCYKNMIEPLFLSQADAEEMCMAYAFEDGLNTYNQYGYLFSHKTGMHEAEEAMSEWYVWEYEVI